MRTLVIAMLLVLVSFAAGATAGGLGLPTSHAGLGIGNLDDFAGVRLNFMDRGVRSVTGLNLTVWPDDGGRRNGAFRGLGVHLVGNSGREFSGVYVSLIGLEATESAAGVFVNGIGMGGGEVNGLVIAGIGVGADDLTGIVIAGIGAGAANVTGVLLAGLGAGAENVTGVAAALLGFGAENVTGVVVAGLGTGAEDITGVAIGGLGMGADTLTGAGIGGGVRTRKTTGAALAVAYQRTDFLAGVSTGLYNRADEASGLMIGVYNHAETLRGVQIGLLNHVGSGPAAARWLPLINARF